MGERKEGLIRVNSDLQHLRLLLRRKMILPARLLLRQGGAVAESGPVQALWVVGGVVSVWSLTRLGLS